MQLKSEIILLGEESDALGLVLLAELLFFLELLGDVLDLGVLGLELVLGLDDVEEGLDLGVEFPPVPVAELNELSDVALDALGGTATIEKENSG